MPTTEPTAGQRDLIRNLVKSVTLDNIQTEYEKAILHFKSKEEFQAALRLVELEIEHHLMLIKHWLHVANQ